MARRGRRKGRVPTWVLEFLASPFIVILIGYAWYRGAPFKVVAAMSGLAVAYFLFFAPRTCGALNKQVGDTCGNRAHGLLGGCWIPRHRRQNRWRFVPGRYRPRGVRAAFATSPRRFEAEPEPRSDRTTAMAQPIPLDDPPVAEVGTVLALIEVACSFVSLVVASLAWVFPRV